MNHPVYFMEIKDENDSKHLININYIVSVDETLVNKCSIKLAYNYPTIFVNMSYKSFIDDMDDLIASQHSEDN